jgi:hypothetical protein
MQAALPFGFFRIGGRAEKSIEEDSNSCNHCCNESEYSFRVAN